jgi:hypothetical protein
MARTKVRAPVCRCNDCGVDVVQAGEYYMLTPKIWDNQLGLGWDDNLCIGCLENRLGRRVSMTDLFSFPRYPWMKGHSIRLLHRMFGHGVTKRPPYRWRKSWLRNTGGFTRARAKAIGEYAETLEPPQARGRLECQSS